MTDIAEISIFENIIKEGKIHIHETNYFTKKGFSLKNIKKYSLGFLTDGLSKYSNIINEDKDILMCYKYIIPYYFEKKLDYIIFRKCSITEKRLKIPFEIKKTYILGNKNKMWNYHYLFLLEENFLIFITETWTDALSIEEIGYKAISLNGIDNIQEFWKILKKVPSKKNGKFILICDNDIYGKKANSFLKNILENLGFEYLIYDNYPKNIKDCNEWLQFNKKLFKESMENFIKDNKKNIYSK